MEELDEGEIEARSWLMRADGKQHSLSESSEMMIADDDLLRVVDELYSAGATRVTVLRVEIDDDWEDASRLRITLPDDPEARSRVLTIHSRMLREYETCWDPEEDHGQP